MVQTHPTLFRNGPNLPHFIFRTGPHLPHTTDEAEDEEEIELLGKAGPNASNGVH